MEWFKDLTEVVEGLVAWGALIGWIDRKLDLRGALYKLVNRLARRSK